jgi:hypothetical protein
VVIILVKYFEETLLIYLKLCLNIILMSLALGSYTPHLVFHTSKLTIRRASDSSNETAKPTTLPTHVVWIVMCSVVFAKAYGGLLLGFVQQLNEPWKIKGHHF